IYIKQDDAFVLKETFGWNEENSGKRQFAFGQGIAGQAAARSKVLTVRDFLTEGENDKALAHQDCLMAGPLQVGEKGETVGILCVQKVPFLNFNTASINLFSFLLNWANRSIGRAY